MSCDLEDSRGDEFIQLQRRIFKEMETWLDRAESVGHLEDPGVARVVQEAIQFRIRQSIWRVMEYVLMPSHMHMYLKMESGGLKDSLQGFKEWTGREAAGIVALKHGRFWQREWFDHWARTPEEGEKIKDYIQNNPVKAGLVSDYREWPFGSWQ